MKSELEAAFPPISTLGRTSISYGHPLPSGYGRISERVRRSAPGELQCSVFCGGSGCKYERADCWPAGDTAIRGIYSHWMTDDIVAMARPNTESMLRYDVVRQFLDLGVGSVFNLQLPGEHGHCGGPLESSGFSYDPQRLMDAGIFFYNFGWRDYGTPDNAALLDVVKVMAFALSEGKVAVHCHAGLGRTGVLVACYLVYALRCRPNDAIRYVRLKRRGSVQTHDQIACVQKFAQFLLPMFVVYPIEYSKPHGADKYRPTRAADLTLHQYLAGQRKVAHGLEARHLRHIPKIVYALCERLLELCRREDETFRLSELKPFCKRFLSGDDRRQSWHDGAATARRDDRSDAGLSSAPNSPDHDEEELEPSEGGGGGGEEGPMADNPCYRELSSQKELRATVRTAASHTSSQVAAALLREHLSPGYHVRLKQWKRDLNTRGSAWDRLDVEQDVGLLSGLLWSWLDGLREPVLNRSDLTFIVVGAEDPASVLLKLDRGTRFTTEYLVRFVSRLGLPTLAERRDLLRRLCASLCHQRLVVGGTPCPGPSWPKMRDGTAARVTLFVEGLYDAVGRQAETPLRHDESRSASGCKTFRGINIMASAIAR